MAVDMDADAVTSRLREACRQMAEPIVVRSVIPDGAEVEARLREACALWVLCASLGELDEVTRT